MAYADLRGVRTWYEERGAGEPLVMLHGGIVYSRFFEPNLEALAERFHLYAPDRYGHGRTRDVEGPMTFEAGVDQTVALLENVVGNVALSAPGEAGAVWPDHRRVLDGGSGTDRRADTACESE
jgi:pimeloyl-ACP methyl ester carboxylesterase